MKQSARGDTDSPSSTEDDPGFPSDRNARPHDHAPTATNAPPPVLIGTESGLMQVTRFGNPEGPVVLCIHGSPGGWDQAALMGSFLAEAGFSIIAPSRPGYLGTQLSDANDSPQRQARQLVDLLDALDVDRAGVLAWSGGGPTAYQLALNHPDRVTALVQVAPVSEPVDWQIPLVDRLLMGSLPGEAVMRSLMRIAPRQVVTGMLRSEGELEPEEVRARADEILNDPPRLAFTLATTRSASKRSDRAAGISNDQRQFATLSDLELERITVPTLIVHGEADAEVSVGESKRACARIPNAELVEIPRGTHMALYVDPGYAEAQRAVIDFLTDHAHTPSSERAGH